MLDVAFGEDLSRQRTRNAAENFSLLNRIALNLNPEVPFSVSSKT